MPGLGWEMSWDRAEECQEQGWEILGLGWDQTGNCAGIGTGSSLGLGWEMPALGCGAFQDWAGKLTRNELGSVPGSDWDWADKFTGMNWETYLKVHQD